MRDENNMKGVALWLLLVAVCHMILGFAFAAETPYRSPGVLASQRNPQTGTPMSVPDVGAPDERQHANYIQTLLEGKGFPIFKPGSSDAGEHYEDHQPPLYYMLAAGFARIVGVHDVADPDAARLRWLNVLMGGVTVVGVFFLGLWSLGRSDIALAAAAIAAFLPMNAALSGAISNDPLLYALCTWTVAFCALAVRQGWNWRRAVAVGVLTGLALLTKTTGIALVLPILVAVVAKKPSLPQIVVAVALVAALVAPWWARNQQLYGDPLAMKAFNQAFTGSPQAEVFIQSEGQYGYWVNWVGWWTARSFFGVFGYMDLWLNETGTPSSSTPNLHYRLLIVISLILFLAWLATFRDEKWKEAKPAQIMNAVFLVAVVALFLRFNMQYFQAQGRYLYPAIGPIALALAAGAWALFKESGKYVAIVMALALLLFSGLALVKLPEAFRMRTQSVSSLLRCHVDV